MLHEIDENIFYDQMSLKYNFQTVMQRKVILLIKKVSFIALNKLMLINLNSLFLKAYGTFFDGLTGNPLKVHFQHIKT